MARLARETTPLNAIHANVALVIEQLTASQPILAGMVSRGEVKVVGADYSLQTGQVTITVQSK